MTEQITGIETTFIALFGGGEVPETDGRLPLIRSVEIPLIQRDYAQGRTTDKVEDIRSAFLEALRGAIVADEHLSLDFVYGGVDEGVLRPLDGQQRLTTLFLLHWYLANRCGRADADARWGSFSYDTRPGARRFCELLVKSPAPEGEDWEHLSAWLIDQPWFLYRWEQDPTISSMLVMLDSIHTTFADVDAEMAWKRLTDSSRPAISFFVLPIEEVGAGDDLYIKMNSRGKPLTDFETFKARFEQAIQPPDRATRVAHKLDGPWADIFWPYHGGDNIVDDEFLRYIEFLVDVGEWRAGAPTENRLLTRATQLLGGGADSAAQALDFFERALDTWSGEAIGDFFETLFRRPDQARVPDDLRPTLFTPDWLNGVNLFEMCCHNYGGMRGDRVRAFPLGLTILLYGALIHRIERTDEPLTRLRVLRNLVESSENEIRVERMSEHLAEVETLMRTGDVGHVKSFNQVQVADEVRKAEFLTHHPECAASLALLEDHRLLRGTLTALELDSTTVAGRARAFVEVFADNTLWPSLTGALLACGDYFRRRNAHSFQFGSPTTDSWWRTLLTGPARTPLEQIREPLGAFLDQVAQRGGTLQDAYDGIIAPWLDEREQSGDFDWRYHFTKYPAMREGTSGIYITEDGELGYEVCAMKRSNLNSWYRDPYLLAIYQSLGVDRHRLEDPWYMGYARTPRWLRVRRTDIALRSVHQGLEIAVPPDLFDEVAPIVRSVMEVEERPGGFLWPAPQRIVAGMAVDTVDRVLVGTSLIQRLLREVNPGSLRQDLREELEVRGHTLSTLIGERLNQDADLRRNWVWIPRDRDGAWVAFELADGRCIELIMRPNADAGIGLAVKAYPSYGKLQNLFPGFDHVPLGPGWWAPDSEIVDAFLEHVSALHEHFPRP